MNGFYRPYFTIFFKHFLNIHPPPSSSFAYSEYIAICFGHLDITKFLLEKYPESIDSITNDGSTVWHTAAWAGHLQIMHLLCEIKPQGASITRKNGEIPLHVAMRRQNYHIAQMLLDAYPQGSAVKSPLSGYKPLQGKQQMSCIVYHLLFKSYDSFVSNHYLFLRLAFNIHPSRCFKDK